MRLTILGSSSATPAAGGACSGYLVEEGRVRLLLDCGTGVLSNLQTLGPPEEITDIAISHMHFDHFLDLIPFGYRRLYGPAPAGEPPKLHLPPGGRGILSSIVAQVGAGADFFERAFQVTEYDPRGEVLLREPLQLTFAQVPHYAPSYAIAVAQSDGARLVFSSDGGPSEALARLATSADLLLCEATLDVSEPADTAGHMTALQAARLARTASVRQLVLTHFWPWQDRGHALAQASAEFGERVAIAREGDSYAVGSVSGKRRRA